MKIPKSRPAPAWRAAAYALSLVIVLSVNLAFAARAALMLT